MSLSVILITRNEEANIGACLESVAFADEIIVVDSGSTDATVEIAKKHGARTVTTADWPGFGAQKQRALDLATSDWVLSIDADERATPELAEAICKVITGPKPAFDAYEFSRRNWYCGRFLDHSGASPDYIVRLFRRGTARFSDHLVHERIMPTGKVGRLDGKLLHYSFLDFSEVIGKIDSYSTASAKQALAAGKTASVGKAIRHASWMFFRVYVLKLGFLDGAQGLAKSISAAQGTYYRYLKIWFARL
ncbi:MAG: glycosyltransferase family 2 protein [Mesorhizobium sp.]